MPPRYQSRPTDLLTRVRNEMDALGRPGMAGTSRLGGNRGRGGGQASVVADGTQENDEGANGAAQMLVMSVTGDSIAAGGDHVEFDQIVAQHDFAGVPAPHGGAWSHPVSGTFALLYDHTWDARTTAVVQLELDGVLIPEGVIIPSGSGCRGFGAVTYAAVAGQVGRVKVTHTEAVAQTCSASVQIAITDPDDVEPAAPLWEFLFAADAFDIFWDGASWWTTQGVGSGSSTVTERDATGAAVSSFTSAIALTRGITMAGSTIWISGDHSTAQGGNGTERIASHSTAGSNLSTITTDPTAQAGNVGMAWDGTDLWLLDIKGTLQQWSTAGTKLSSFPIAADQFNGVAFYDGLLYAVNTTTSELVAFTTAGAQVGTLSLAGTASGPTGVHIDADGTLYVSKDGVGVWQYLGAL